MLSYYINSVAALIFYSFNPAEMLFIVIQINNRLFFTYFNSIVTVYQKIQYISFVCEIAVKVALLDNFNHKKSVILRIFH